MNRFLLPTLLTLVLCFALACGPTTTPAPAATTAPSATINAPSATTAAVVPAPTAAPVAPPRGGEYRIANTSDAPKLHPYQATDTASFAYIDRMFLVPLWRYNPETLEPEGVAAESWTVSDDKTTYTFKLRAIKWSDGKPEVRDGRFPAGVLLHLDDVWDLAARR